VNRQIKFAIIAISIVIPLSSYSVLATESTPEISQKDNLTKIQVISSFYPLYEFAQHVGKERVDVQLLVPTGVEPHDWEPTIQDVQKMQKSDIIIINGFGFENWVPNFVETNYLGTIVDTSNGITMKDFVTFPDHIDEDDHKEDDHKEDDHKEDDHKEDDHSHTSGDPHIWLNPNFAKIQVQNIADAFSVFDSSNQQFYQNNAENYISKLEKLDTKIRNDLSECNQDFITFHNAFSYFASEYDLHPHTIISSNDSHAEPTAKTLEKIIYTARELNIKIIFAEDTSDQRISKVIANEIGGKILILSPIEISGDGNYISRMNKNLENLREALC
jgi:zinc transport system substrate-binding protein